MAEMEDDLLIEPKKIIATKSWTVTSPNDQVITLQGRCQIGGPGGRVGFLGNTPANRFGYTANGTPLRTMPAYTSDTENVAYTAADVAALLVHTNNLRVAYENLRASHEALRQVVAAMVTDLKTYGLFG